MNNLFLKAHFDTTNGSKNVILRATHLLTQREILSDVQWLDLSLALTRKVWLGTLLFLKTCCLRTQNDVEGAGPNRYVQEESGRDQEDLQEEY